jgi:hypothetical protein
MENVERQITEKEPGNKGREGTAKDRKRKKKKREEGGKNCKWKEENRARKLGQ